MYEWKVNGRLEIFIVKKRFNYKEYKNNTNIIMFFVISL